MTDEQTALSRRAVACRGWRWMPGMSYWWVGSQDRVADEERGTLRTDGSLLPDFSDPATLGCLLHLVRTAWGAPRALVRLSSDGRSLHVFDVDRVNPTGGNWAAWLSDDRCPSEAEALVFALESAP